MSFALLRRLALPVFVCLFSGVAAADVLEEVLDRGTIRIGVAEYVPWTMKTKSGQLVGSEIDIGNKLASDMGVEVEFKSYAWTDIIPALQRGEIDIISAGMSITPARALQVNFTRPIAASGSVLVTNMEMTADIGSLEELNAPDMIVVASENSFSHSVAKMLFNNAELRAFDTPAEAEQQVVEGKAHAYVAGLVQARFLTLRHGDVVDMPLGDSDPLVGYREAMAVRKGEQELLNFLNAWIEARTADKWLASTRDYWFESLDWAEDIKE